MTATEPSANGKPARKQLGDQIDRLDAVIDVLADGLPQAVADACREGARQAVKDAVVEILASPELRALIAGVAAARVAPPKAPEPPPAPPAPPKPGFWARTKARLMAGGVAARARLAESAGAWAAVANALSGVVPVRKALAVGSAAGVAVAVVSYVSPHALAAAAAGLGGMAAAVAAQVGAGVLKAARKVGLV